MGKRVADLTLGTLLAVVATPVILAAALVSAATFRAWPFFVQDRVGHEGRLFRFVKVRTLPPDVPQYSDKYSVQNVRVPRLARFLRRYKIDELPQLFLVPFGRLSLVGPRPEMPQLHARLDDGFAEDRVSVRPGCTGLWQIGAECSRLIGEAPEFDEFYILHRSLRLDAWILARTLRVLGGGQPVTLADVPNWAKQTRSRSESSASARLEPADI